MWPYEICALPSSGFAGVNFTIIIAIIIIIINHYLNALRAYTATVPMTQYDVPEVSRRFRPHLPLHFAMKIPEK